MKETELWQRLQHHLGAGYYRVWAAEPVLAPCGIGLWCRRYVRASHPNHLARSGKRSSCPIANGAPRHLAELSAAVVARTLVR